MPRNDPPELTAWQSREWLRLKHERSKMADLFFKYFITMRVRRHVDTSL